MDLRAMQHHVTKVAKRFYEAFQVEGFVKFYFTLDDREESDGNSIYNVYLMPLDEKAMRSMNGKGSLHLQLLADSLPSDLLNNSFKAEMTCPKINFFSSRFKNLKVNVC